MKLNKMQTSVLRAIGAQSRRLGRPGRLVALDQLPDVKAGTLRALEKRGAIESTRYVRITDAGAEAFDALPPEPEPEPEPDAAPSFDDFHF